MVELFIHAHDRDACLGIARKDRMRDGRSAAMTRQQRSVHVDRSESRDRQHRRRDDLSISDDDQQVRSQQRRRGDVAQPEQRR